MMPPMNNPVMAMVNIVRNGGNPMAFMQQMARTNPQINQIMQMVNGKNPSQLRSMAENIAKEKGTSIEQVAQQLGISIPGGK